MVSMTRKLWAVFLISQIIGVSLFFYSSRFEAGVGGFREFVWIPAMLVLLPGILFGYAADALGLSNGLTRWYGLPFFAVVVLLNAGFWIAIMVLIQRWRRPVKA
jgi:hypothetical protein